MGYSHLSADEQIADAIWWFKGFRAAMKLEDRDETDGLAENLRRLRDWLGGLPYGFTRLVGTADCALGCVLTEAEFEQVFDALRGTDEEREVGLATMRRVLDQFSNERRDLANARNKEIPF